MRNIINFQTDLLRTFVTVDDLGDYTKPGGALGRTQPAISLQMRRPEELLGAPLETQTGRTLLVTHEGGLPLQIGSTSGEERCDHTVMNRWGALTEKQKKK